MTSSTSDGYSHREKVAWILKRMQLNWGKAFVDKWAMLKPGEMLDDWEMRLRGVSEIELRRGIAKLNDFERPPDLPAFLKACRPEVNPLNAYYEALEGCRSRERGEVGTWSHPAIYWASVRVTAFELNTQSYSQIRQRWETALAAELAKDQWETITAPLIQIAGPVKGKLSRESATKMIEQELMKAGAILKGGILADAKVKKGSMPVDGKGWARKIMQRHAAGDKTLMPIQIQFARQALGNFEKDNDE